MKKQRIRFLDDGTGEGDYTADYWGKMNDYYLSLRFQKQPVASLYDDGNGVDILLTEEDIKLRLTYSEFADLYHIMKAHNNRKDTIPVTQERDLLYTVVKKRKTRKKRKD